MRPTYFLTDIRKLEKYDCTAPNGITLIPSFAKIDQLVRKLLDFICPLLSLQTRKVGYEDVKRNTFIRKGRCMIETKKKERGNKKQTYKGQREERGERRDGREFHEMQFGRRRQV